MREIVILESLPKGGVQVLGRTEDAELVRRVSAEVARLERRRLARLEGLRLVPAEPAEEEPEPAPTP